MKHTHIQLTLPTVLLLFGLGQAALSGCVASSNTTPEIAPTSERIIIKFAPSVSDPSAQIFVNQLARDARVALVYVRAMSGGAHVFELQNIRSPAMLDDAIKNLSKNAEIIYVEPDRKMHIE